MIFNLKKNKCLSRAPFYAVSALLKMRGMIGRNFNGAGFDAMVFENCNAIHTLFMSINIDVIFVDRENIICGIQEKLRPWRPLICCKNAVAVLELPEGKIYETGTEIGDIIDLRAELSPEFSRSLEKKFIEAAETVIPYTKSRK